MWRPISIRYRRPRESGGPGPAPGLDRGPPAEHLQPLGSRFRAGLSGESEAVARPRSCPTSKESPWPDLVRPSTSSARRSWLAQDVDARDEPGQGALGTKIRGKRPPERPLNFPRTALRFRGNDVILVEYRFS
jgi:hypothetical protein